MIEALLVCFTLLYIAEGWHDSKIEAVQKRDDVALIIAWHKADVYFHIMMNVTIAYASYGISWNAVVLGVMLLGFRQLFMVTSLNIFRGRKIFYLGSTAKFDKIVKRGENLIFVAAGAIILIGYSILKL